jgi:hypothetical protein
LRHALGKRGAVAGLVWLAACTPRPVLVQANPAVSGTKFKVIATVAGGDAAPDIRMSVTVRQELNEGGWTAVRRAGRWENEQVAVADICDEGGVDGVLFVDYNRLRLDDCASRRQAFRIEGSPDRGVGLTEMIRRLKQYLRGGGPSQPGT